jgi:hypothetical protein
LDRIQGLGLKNTFLGCPSTVNLIASTKPRSGSAVRAELDIADYPKDLVI